MVKDDDAFIFTLKNPHGVEPTRFMKRKGSEYAISCYSCYGPIFCDDIHIDQYCNTENSCWIGNDGEGGYECHPIYKESLFVNTDEPNYKNYFSVLDCEVFGIDFENRDNINVLCKYPDIIWECIETKDISAESLKQFDDDIELLSDLDAILCNDEKLRLKISQLCLKNPSKFLPTTHLVSQQYDGKLREWLGKNYKWKLIYRASEHRYTASSFHEHCDNVKGPTLVVIKSSGSWIFGGYTTKSWSGRCIYYDML